VINEHFEEDFNAVLSSAIVFQQPVRYYCHRSLKSVTMKKRFECLSGTALKGLISTYPIKPSGCADTTAQYSW
jgi:hypothetical protein